MKILFVWLCTVYLIVTFPVYSQDTVSYYTLTGRVVDKVSHERLLFVTVSVPGTNIATVTNQEGNFVLKVPAAVFPAQLAFSYIGYKNRELPLTDFKTGRRKTIELERASILLPEVVVMQAEGEALLKEVIRRIPRNYSSIPNQMVGFYREMIRKNGTYISLAEAVLDIYKAPYDSYVKDKVKIYKGRKGTDKARSDTVFVKYQGGVNTALELDLAKHFDLVFPPDFSAYYQVYCESCTMLGERLQYILSFDQRKEIRDPWFRGKLYIDAETFAIIRAEFHMNVEQEEKATEIFLRRKPAGMKVKIEEANYLIQFRFQDDKWYYQNSRAELSFKCRWPRKLFNSRYTLLSEMAVTDRTAEGVSRFPREERLLPGDVITEKVTDLEDEAFWESYNIIEPEQTIENAIRRLARKLRRNALKD